MIKEVIKNWPGTVRIDDEELSAEEASSRIDFKTLQTIKSISLLTKHSEAIKSNSDAKLTYASNEDEVTITVKPYMTKKATPEFDFMAQWNNDIPMPLVTMAGTKVKETKGMVYMKLHGFAKRTITCMCCGRELTNPISRQYGIGPICLEKIGIARNIEDVDGIVNDLVNTTWEGWIIKSAILKESE